MSKFNFEQVRKNVDTMKSTLPRLLANQAQVFFTDSFNKGGWEGTAWKTPKRKIPGTKEYKYPLKKGLQRRTKPTLIKAGILRRAVSMSARVIRFDSIKLVVDQPYADRHNEGKDGMPKRQFMGDSKTLRGKQVQLIKNEIEKIWRV